MNNIEWKDGAVCYAGGKQWFEYAGSVLTTGFGNVCLVDQLVSLTNFKLNEIRIGDYIEKSELDTEEKYNDAVEVFRLFGFEVDFKKSTFNSHWAESLILCHGGKVDVGGGGLDFVEHNYKRKLTYNQLMTIGKLKRLMDEEEDSDTVAESVKVAVAVLDANRKEKLAYEILNSLDYEYDGRARRWYKKEWV